MREEILYKQVDLIFLGILGRKLDLRPEMSAKDVPGWDSFNHVKLILAIEDHFQVEFHIEEINALKTIKDLVHLLSLKL